MGGNLRAGSSPASPTGPGSSTGYGQLIVYPTSATARPRTFAGLAQLEEQSPCKRQVTGSNPVAGSCGSGRRIGIARLTGASGASRVTSGCIPAGSTCSFRLTPVSPASAGATGAGMKRCEYCKTLQSRKNLKRGAMFGSRICKDRAACDARKLVIQRSGR